MSELKHYGVPRKSGRYPWGSGENPYQSANGFRMHVAKLKAKGMTEAQIAKSMGMKTTEFRAYSSIAKAHARDEMVREVMKYKDKGYSNTAIGEKLGINESSVRSYLDPVLKARSDEIFVTANMLAESIKNKGPIDIGAGTELHLGISRVKLQNAIAMLEAEGYQVMYIPVTQLGTGKQTTVLTLAKPGDEWIDVFNNKHEISSITDYSTDGGKTYTPLEPPNNINSDRIEIRYKEDGGSDMDGVIQIRPGVDDISLGNSSYAQVRVGVDGTHYLKGMAMYTDDLPDGVDIRYNVNKDSSYSKHDVMKEQVPNMDNPFGATYKQKHYVDKNGEEKLSALNIVNEEGTWDTWSKNLSSQMLSKQRASVISDQLKLDRDIRKEELDAILKLNNPVIKKNLLEGFADGTEAAADDLKAAALPRQSTKVILPVNSLKDNEIYAPTYRDGENVVLIRHPHGGIFEIPELIVNNKNAYGNKYLKQAPDAVGINAKVAGQLSGADFDGDTVIVIPNKSGAVKTSKPLAGLKDFDPQERYPAFDGMKRMTKGGTQLQMGNISNLITDMSIIGATDSELAKAVRHSMVVIDAEKHNLNYKQSEIDNGIAALKTKFQGGANRGASTIVSKADSAQYVPERKQYYNVNKKTGKKEYTETGNNWTDEKGKTHYRTTKSTKMRETDDAHTLSSGTRTEKIYADHANELKAMTDLARKEAVNTPRLVYSPSAKKTYATEVASLNAKLNTALKNAPIERQAQLVGNAVYEQKKADNPSLDKDQLKRLRGQELAAARIRTGADRQQVEITEKEWEAIQHGAVSHSKLEQILNNADDKRVKELATPRTSTGMTAGALAKAQSMLKRGYTQAEVADSLGIGVGTLANALK